jgi:hypothetical protein
MTGRAYAARAVLCFLIGFVLLVPGAGIIVLGWTGSASGTPQEVFTPTAALVAPASGLFGRLTTSKYSTTAQVRVDLAVTPGPRRVFVGLAQTTDLARYLGSTPVDEMSRAGVAGARSYVLTRHGEGSPRALPPPAQQGFWVAQASGADAHSIDWVTATGTVELVVMNADGTAGVDQQLAPTLFFISTRPLAIVMVLAGAVALLVGALYFVFTAGDRDDRSPGLGAGDLAL